MLEATRRIESRGSGGDDMSIYLDKTLGKWRATYNYCGRKYRIPGLYMTEEEAREKWTELDRYIQGDSGSSVEERVYRFFVTVNRKKLSGDDSSGGVLSCRNSYKYDGKRQPGIMYETYLYDKLCDNLLRTEL